MIPPSKLSPEDQKKEEIRRRLIDSASGQAYNDAKVIALAVLIVLAVIAGYLYFTSQGSGRIYLRD